MKKFTHRFPGAERDRFQLGTVYGDNNVYYEDNPTEVWGDNPASTFNDRVKKAIGLSISFPMSLQARLSNDLNYPIPGTEYGDKPAHILNEFEIVVNHNQSFHASFRQIFKSTTIHFSTAGQCKRWLSGPNLSYWPQQLNFAVWCATSGCGISLNENYPKRIQEFINWHNYFTIRRILWELATPLPDDSIFNQTSNHYDKIAYQRLCQEFNLDEHADFRFRGGRNHGLGTIFVNGGIPPRATGLVGWPNSTPIFHDEPGIGGVNGKIINLANLGRPQDWFAPHKGVGLTRAGLGRLNRSMEAFVYCIVGAEVNTRSSIIDSGGGGQETQQELLKLFEESVIEEDIANSIQRYQLVVEEAKLRLDFAVAPDIWLMPANLVINTESVIGYNNFLLKAKKEMTFGENKLLNNQLRTVGVAHNLGHSKLNQINRETIAPMIQPVEVTGDDKDDDNGVEPMQTLRSHDKAKIDNARDEQESLGSPHDLLKATVMIVAVVVGYMMFR